MNRVRAGNKHRVPTDRHGVPLAATMPVAKDDEVAQLRGGWSRRNSTG